MSILQGDNPLETSCAAQIVLPEPSARISTDSHSPAVVEARVRIIVAVGLAVIGVICLVARLLYPFDFIGDHSHGWLVDYLLPRIQRFVGSWSLEMMLFYPFGLLGIFLLERFFPAIPTQKTLSTGLINDAIWVLVNSVTRLVVVVWYGRLIYGIYAKHLSFLTLPVTASLPMAARLAMGVLVADLMLWCQHWLYHHVKWIWPFHAVHHAQRELNLFSETRVHCMEHLVRRPVVLLPMLMLGLELPEVTWWLLFMSWHARFQHANIRSNLGPLRYLIVTPQSHRVHHSIRAEHVNHNYGSMLSIWDHLFGTQVRQYDIYPETGIDDEAFPHESARSVWGVLSTVGRQLVYPFRCLWMMGRSRVR